MEHKTLVLLIVFHIIFDFVLQDREMAKNKSSSFKYLGPHLYILFVGLVIFVAVSNIYTGPQGFIFIFGNVLAHGLIDWNIWKLYKAYTHRQIKKNKRLTLVQDCCGESYKYWSDSMFYNFIAIDQGLHGLCYVGFDWLARAV